MTKTQGGMEQRVVAGWCQRCLPVPQGLQFEQERLPWKALSTFKILPWNRHTPTKKGCTMDATHLSQLTPHKLFTSLIIHEFALALQKQGIDDEGAEARDSDDDDGGNDDDGDVRELSFALADELLQARLRRWCVLYFYYALLLLDYFNLNPKCTRRSRMNQASDARFVL
jgi:hypothetical protein